MMCRICHTQGDHAVVEAREMMYGWGDKHRYFTCRHCGCLQIEHIPADIARYYGPGYYSFRGTDGDGLRALIAGLRNRHAVLGGGRLGGLLFKLMPTQTFDFLAPIRTRLTRQSAILDVGCGAGHLIKLFRQAGFDHAVGVDPFIAAQIDHGGRPLVLRQSLEDVADRYDLVMFHHSLEHMPDQQTTLRAAQQLLREGGSCVVRVPLSSSQAWRHYGIHWVQLDAPRHFYLHTPQSLAMLASQCGLSVVDTRFDSTAFQFWGSEQYLRGMALKDPKSYAENPAESMFNNNQIAEFARRAANLNSLRLGDQGVFLLQKSANHIIAEQSNEDSNHCTYKAKH